MNERLPEYASTSRRSKNSFTFVPLSTPPIKAGIALQSRRSHSIASAGSVNSAGEETDEWGEENGEETGEGTEGRLE
jgi:hypothetical protein